MTAAGGQFRRTYNGDGLRVSRMVDGATTDYVWDVGSALPVILQETAGGQTTYYVYGLDLISQIDGAGNEEYFLYDGLGSTRQLADNSGDVVATYEYDVFGALRAQTGSADTHFRFTGEQWDSETGFYYLRARYYGPAIGRFVSQDPFSGLVRNPQTLNLYTYVVNNPVSVVDPCGLCGFNGFGDFGDCFTPENIKGGSKKAGGAVASINLRNVATGGVLIVAGGALITISAAGIVIVVPLEIAAAPATGGLSLVLLPHTVAVFGLTGAFGVLTAACGVEVAIQGDCDFVFPGSGDPGSSATSDADKE